MCTDDLVLLVRRLSKRSYPQVPPRHDQPADAFPKESGGYPTGRVGSDDHDIYSELWGKLIETPSQHAFRSKTQRRRHVVHRRGHPSDSCSVSHDSRIRLSFSALSVPYASLRERTDGGKCNPGFRPSADDGTRYNSGP